MITYSAVCVHGVVHGHAKHPLCTGPTHCPFVQVGPPITVPQYIGIRQFAMHTVPFATPAAHVTGSRSMSPADDMYAVAAGHGVHDVKSLPTHCPLSQLRPPLIAPQYPDVHVAAQTVPCMLPAGHPLMKIVGSACVHAPAHEHSMHPLNDPVNTPFRHCTVPPTVPHHPIPPVFAHCPTQYVWCVAGTLHPCTP